MTMEPERLMEALHMLGEVLDDRGLAFDLVVIGGGALVLQGVIARATEDLDAVARVENERLRSAEPFPADLVQAIRDVADALALAREPTADKDWLNAGPAILRDIGLPAGALARATTRRFGALTLRVAARADLVAFKLWAAMDPRRGAARSRDVQDLRALAPSDEELRCAIHWCIAKDGRDGVFEMDIAPVLNRLGHDPDGFAP